MPVGSPTLGDPVTIGDLVARIQRDLRGATPTAYDILAGGLTAVATDEAAAVTYGIDQIQPNTLVGIGEETLLVRSVAGLNITFARGAFNSKITAHSALDVVEVDPTFFPAAVGDTIVEEIRSWPEELYQVREADLNFGATDQAIDWTGGPTGFRWLLGASFYGSGGDHYVDAADITVTPNAPTSLYASGFSLRRPYSGDSGIVHVVYAADFTVSAVTFATTLASIGLSPSLYDAALYGALWRLLAPREVMVLNRTAQPEPRTAADTPPGRTISVAASYKQLRDQRISEEITRLRAAYPVRF